MIFIRFMN